MIASLMGFALTALALPTLTKRFGPRMFALAALVPAAVSVWLLTQLPSVSSGATPAQLAPWIPQLGLSFAFRLDALTITMGLIVTGVGTLVVLYCARYFSRGEEGIGRFSGVLVAFAGAMFGLVVSDDIYLLFMFWEATTVFSYLLIGQYTNKRKSRGAALQALLVTTAGGLAMLVGVVILAVQAGTTRVSEIVASPPAASGLVTVAVILVLIGALSKSAQVPLHFWLPSAMAAPTPVSAYLHAAAMVKAGIFLIALLVPAFGDTPGWRPVLVAVGVLTMLVGGWRALRQHDLKLLLAYGTVSQLGFLTVVVGYGTRNAALAGITLITGHALFKATLFLVVGIIDQRLGTRDLRKISGPPGAPAVRRCDPRRGIHGRTAAAARLRRQRGGVHRAARRCRARRHARGHSPHRGGGGLVPHGRLYGTFSLGSLRLEARRGPSRAGARARRLPRLPRDPRAQRSRPRPRLSSTRSPVRPHRSGAPARRRPPRFRMRPISPSGTVSSRPSASRPSPS
jgi:formate hydrogenlyase subunit 3/multisubunit Na+/H+ antiporter MnhD subunit